MFKWIFKTIIFQLILVAMFYPKKGHCSDPWAIDYSPSIEFNTFLSVGALFDISSEEQNINPTTNLNINIFGFGDEERIRVLSPSIGYVGRIDRIAMGLEIAGYQFDNGLGIGIPLYFYGETGSGFTLTYTFGGN